jgi:hypothetical protein
MNEQQEQANPIPDHYAHLNRNGRKPGTPNKATKTFRETITKLLSDNSANVGVWLERVSEDDPAKALDLLAKLAEYAAPKLSKVEQTIEGNITHGYAFKIERPSRPAIDGLCENVQALEQSPDQTLDIVSDNVHSLPVSAANEKP